MKNKLILILLFISIFVIYLVSSSGITPYNYFVLLAKQFLEGRYYLLDNPPWLNELIPLKGGGYGVVYPPTPAIIAMPLVYFFGADFPQNMISYFLGAGLAILIAKIGYLKTNNIKIFYWFLILGAFGNIAWFLSSNGSVWYLGQVSGSFFLTATIYESLTKRRPYLISTLFALAVFSRLQIILAFPIIAYLNYKDLNLKKFVNLSLPFSIFVLFFLTYNYLRFGNIFETGYSLIPGVLEEPWYNNGIFHYSYIPNSLKAFALSTPIFTSDFPYVKPSWSSLSILITTPVFIYSLFASLRIKENVYTFISLLLIALVSLSHGGIGFTQFGYRYAVDFYPLLYLLMANYFVNKELKWHHNLLLIISVLVNLWGIIWINKFGYVSF